MGDSNSIITYNDIWIYLSEEDKSKVFNYTRKYDIPNRHYTTKWDCIISMALANYLKKTYNINDSVFQEIILSAAIGCENAIISIPSAFYYLAYIQNNEILFEYNKKVISPEFEINISYGFLCDLYKNNNVSQLLSIEDFNKITNDMCNEKSILQITNIFKKAVALDIKYIGTYKRLVFSDNPNEKYENVLQFKCGFENYNSVMSELYKNSFKEKGLINC